jgi:hypothetical protein
MMGVFLVFGPAAAQVAPQSVELAKVNVQKLAAGYRASKVIGSSVTNNANETIGKIDDLLVSPDGKDPYAVLSIGGFLGVGSHLVAVPYDSLNAPNQPARADFKRLTARFWEIIVHRQYD